MSQQKFKIGFSNFMWAKQLEITITQQPLKIGDKHYDGENFHNYKAD